jgi:mannose-6-phosphate isomerase-like protein (cupin superfamily)
MSAQFVEQVQAPQIPSRKEESSNYLDELSAGRLDPGIPVRYERMKRQTLERGQGAIALSPPDAWISTQLSLPLYNGYTTPRATTEKPHWHDSAAEAYCLIDGLAEIWCKWRWMREWRRLLLRPGDVVLVQPHVCHWFRWGSEDGYAAVFKAPQIPGVGRPPAGKTTCADCVHYNNGCVPPDGYST